MPITGRSLAGAGLQGLGEGLQQWSAQTIKRKQIQDEWAFELYKQQLAEQAKQQDAQTAASQKWIEGLMTHPENTAAQLDLAPVVMPNLKPDDLASLRQFGQNYGAQQFISRMNTLAKPEDAPADIGIAMSRATGRDYQTPPPAIDATQFGGEAPDLGSPELMQAINAQKARIAQLDQAEKDKVAQAGAMKRAEAYGTGMGAGAAKSELTPQEIIDENAKTAGEAGPKADAAGLLTHAQEVAKLAPDVIAGGAAKVTADKLAGLTPTVIAAEGNLAGTKKRAEDSAAAAVKYDPANMANEVSLAVDKAQALAKAKGDTARQKYITDAQVGVLRLAPQLAVAKDLYDRAIKGDYQAAKLYHDKVASLAAPIAMATGYTGRMNVLEMQNVSALLPSLAADTVLGTADEKWKNLEATMRYGPLVASQLPPDATVTDALAAVQGLVDREKQARTGGAGGTLPAAAPPPPTPGSAAPPGKRLVFNPTTNRTEWQ
jgi:hypothetical protein